jgi:hypothetical protein
MIRNRDINTELGTVGVTNAEWQRATLAQAWKYVQTV